LEPKLKQKLNFKLFEKLTQNWILASMYIPNQNPDSSNLFFTTIIKSKELVVQTSSSAATGTAQRATPKALPLQFSGPLYDPLAAWRRPKGGRRRRRRSVVRRARLL
jgi:hypothetical protein